MYVAKEAQMNQHKTTLMRLMEVRRGKPNEELLKRLSERYSLVEEIAADLGIQESTAYKWLVRLGFEKRWVKAEAEPEQERTTS